MSFARYNPEDSVLSSETIVRGAWTNDSNTLSNLFTSSIAASNSYYLNVYDSNSFNNLQFAIQYGHVSGSGSSPINPLVVGNTPTRIVYGQYKSLIYNDENASFNFNGIVSDNFYAINVGRSRYKESIKPGSLTLKLSGSEGSGTEIYLTDSSIISGSISSFIGSNRYFTLISGSGGNKAPISKEGISGSYGILFPDLGIILLNGKALANPFSQGGIKLDYINNGSNGVIGNPNQSFFYCFQ